MTVVWLFVKGIFGGIFNFFAKNPILLFALAVSLASIYVGYHWGKSSMEDQYEQLVQKTEKEIKARNDKIAKVEADSKTAAEAAAKEIAAKQALIAKISGDYETRIADLVKNPKIKVVEIQVPGVSTTTTVFVEADGNVSCRRLPQEFVNTIGDMVDAANDGKILQNGSK